MTQSQTETRIRPSCFVILRLRDPGPGSIFPLRQGLWIEDLQTPPGQECSNGSLILLAVVLWRAFWYGAIETCSARRGRAVQRRSMKLLKTKTVRFSQVVERCGKPQVYTLWQKPSADRHLQAQIKNYRVMTILKSDSGTDFGVSAFKESTDARYLIFPKSLKRFADKRIIGIDWSLVRD
jgi:hypothetical protein